MRPKDAHSATSAGSSSLSANRPERLRFFNTYDTAIGHDHLRAFGVVNNFFVTDSPDFERNE
jgi:UDP-N-acetylmuramyl tripeptide synthase